MNAGNAPLGLINTSGGPVMTTKYATNMQSMTTRSLIGTIRPKPAIPDKTITAGVLPNRTFLMNRNVSLILWQPRLRMVAVWRRVSGKPSRTRSPTFGKR